MSTKVPNITAKNLADIAVTGAKALVAVAEAEGRTDSVRSDAYALTASAVLVATANELGRSKAGSAVRKSISEGAESVGVNWHRGSQSKAERVLAHFAEAEGAEFTADGYATVYAKVLLDFGTIWAAYEAINGDDDSQADDPAEILRRALNKARKNGVDYATVIALAGEVFAGE
jgi:hypothetical protein